MNAFAEALARVDSSALMMDMDKYEADKYEMSVDKYLAIKKGYEDTYAIVDETFEKGYVLPVMKRKNTLKGARY